MNGVARSVARWAKPLKSLVITPLISIQTCQLLSQQILMLFCLHLKTGRYLVPTGQTPHLFTRPSILFHPRKGLHKPPSNKLVEVVGTAPTSATFISNVSTSANIFKHRVDLLSRMCIIKFICQKIEFLNLMTGPRQKMSRLYLTRRP